jgi:aryl-alcohol dehydrogenase-like predicted oxidoreductase
LVVPIPGSINPTHLSQNAQATHLDLSADAIARIDAVIGRDSVSGDRYPADWRGRVLPAV